MSEKLTNYKGKQSGRGVKKCLPLEQGDLTASLDLILNSMAINGTQTRKYPNTQQGLEAFKANSLDFFRYLTELNANPDLEKKLIPDIEAWALYVGVSRAMIFNYEKRGGAWADTVQYFKNAIGTAKKQLALNYKIPPVLAIFDAKCNHGYIEPTDSTEHNPNEGITADEKAGESDLVWNDETKRYEPIRGLNDEIQIL